MAEPDDHVESPIEALRQLMNTVGPDGEFRPATPPLDGVLAKLAKHQEAPECMGLLMAVFLGERCEEFQTREYRDARNDLLRDFVTLLEAGPEIIPDHPAFRFALSAFRLGAIMQRKGLVRAETLSRNAIHVQRRHQFGGDTTNTKWQAKRAKYQPKVDEYVGKRHSYLQACKLTANDFNVHYMTVQKHMNNPKRGKKLE